MYSQNYENIELNQVEKYTNDRKYSKILCKMGFFISDTKLLSRMENKRRILLDNTIAVQLKLYYEPLR